MKCERCGIEINYRIKYPCPYILCEACHDYMMANKTPEEPYIPLEDERMKKNEVNMK